MFEWIDKWLSDLLRWIDHTPPMKHAFAAAFILLMLGVIAHLILTVYIPGAGQSARWARLGARSAEAGDPWALAQRLAMEGRYTEAAHALYGALLARVAARVPLRLHPSKTAGDYARDLRDAAPAVYGPFREFARSYEVVIYGLGACDRPRFDGLVDLASRIDPELAPLAQVGRG